VPEPPLVVQPQWLVPEPVLLESLWQQEHQHFWSNTV
jgi:hypothetical protein